MVIAVDFIAVDFSQRIEKREKIKGL